MENLKKDRRKYEFMTELDILLQDYRNLLSAFRKF